MHAYCLFCLSTHTETIRQILEGSYNCTVLQAKILQRKWIKGVAHNEAHPCLPGYLFVYTEEPISSIRQFPRLIGSIRFLTNNKEEGYELQGEDALFAEELYKSQGLISYVPVYRENNLLYIRNGLFHGRVATILKVDHRKQRLLLRFDFDGQPHELWVGYEECEKDTSDPV